MTHFRAGGHTRANEANESIHSGNELTKTLLLDLYDGATSD